MDDTKDKLLNGASAAAAAAAGEAPALPAYDPNLLQFAESLVAGVKNGTITSMAALTVNATGNIQWPAYGMQAPELYWGAGLFQRQLEGIVLGKPGSRILRPGR